MCQVCCLCWWLWSEWENAHRDEAAHMFLPHLVIAAVLLCCPSQADCLLIGYCFSSVFLFAKVC